MTHTCETCGVRPANVRDFTLRGGRWVEADVCTDCASRRRGAILPLLGAAVSALAIAAGATYVVERLTREDRPAPASGPGDWAKPSRAT